jgi:hypothetical protein
MYKFEMTIGWLANGTIKIETNDFDVIEVLREFVEFQESRNWMGAWDATEDEDEIEEEIEEEVEEETV